MCNDDVYHQLISIDLKTNVRSSIIPENLVSTVTNKGVKYYYYTFGDLYKCQSFKTLVLCQLRSCNYSFIRCTQKSLKY